MGSTQSTWEDLQRKVAAAKNKTKRNLNRNQNSPYVSDDSQRTGSIESLGKKTENTQEREAREFAEILAINEDMMRDAFLYNDSDYVQDQDLVIPPADVEISNTR